MWRILEQLLIAPGFHYAITRLSPTSLKRLAFEQKLKRGTWDFDITDKSDELLAAIQHHARSGSILCLGCGGGSLAAALPSESYRRFIGVDLSREAVRQARQYENEKVSFVVDDIMDYRPEGQFDVIVFEESLYYLLPFRRLKKLRFYRSFLTDDGVIVVTTSEYRRFKGMIEMIRKHFDVVEDRFISNSSRHLCVFR